MQSLGREDPLEEENGNPLQYSSLKNSMDRGALQATVHGVINSRTQLSDFTTFTTIHRASLVAQWYGIYLPMQETKVPSLGRKDPLKKEMTTYSSIVVWGSPRDRGAWRATVHGVAGA